MEIIIRKATEKDYPAILTLIKELAAFEKASTAVTNTVEQMQREKDHFDCLVAETPENGIVGMAVYFFAYYTWVGKSLYLDDIYVKESVRGNEIGTKLLNAVCSIAKKEHCNRLRWQVLNWNTKALAFYKRKFGADIDESWLNCGLDKDQIEKYAAQNEPVN